MVFLQPADIYLIDEPSAYLNSEQRIIASKVIKRFIFHAKKTAFVVEHDLIMATYLADKVIVFDGKASVNCTANPLQSLLTGMNMFLLVFLKSYLLNMISVISISGLVIICGNKLLHPECMIAVTQQKVVNGPGMLIFGS